MIKTIASFLVLLVLTLGGAWGAAVVMLSLEPVIVTMPAASPIYENREAIRKLSYPLDCDATTTQGGKKRCHTLKANRE